MVDQTLAVIRTALVGVPREYFHLVTTYESGGIVRERVFCYELYHQMRLLMAAGQRLTVHAEIDKRGHPDFAREDQRNPDFVFHVAGTHRDNTAVLEVKGTVAAPEDIHKDFATLARFLHYGYRAGVFILYNHSFAELAAKVNADTRELARTPGAALIHVFTVPEPETACEEHRLADLADGTD